MVFPCLTRLTTFTRFCVFRKYTLHGHFNRLIQFPGQFPLQQQVTSFHRSTDTSYSQLGTNNVSSSDVDPDLKVFNNAYELVRNSLIADKTLVDAVNRSVRILDYNVQGGKKARGLTVLKAFKLFIEEEEGPSEKLQQACILGWCIEMVQGLFLMLDDKMDNSVTRRGKLCWYKLPGVGENIFLDGFLLEHSIFKVLDFYFGKSELYEILIHNFIQVLCNAAFGQYQQGFDSALSSTRRTFEKFNLENYCTIAQHKTAYHSYCLPVHCAMHLVGNFSEKDFEETRNIGLKLGTLFQIQDDYLDCFGDYDVMGKIGTDITNGTCTWLSATFFEQAPEHLKKIMIENYGVNNEDSASKVKKLYQELKLEEKYHDCVESFKREITLMINDLSRHSLQKLFSDLLKNLHQRKK